MALFGKADVTLALETLRFWSIHDRYGGIEPYVVPIFFKVDGERYLASLRIFHSQQPRDGSYEQPAEIANGLIEIGVDTVKSGTSPNDDDPEIEEDNPYIYVPPGKLLTHGTVSEDAQINLRDVAFRTELLPIPFRIDVSGSYMNLTDALDGLIATIGEDADLVLNLVYTKMSDLIGDLFGLDERLETCPDTDISSSEFLTNIDAHFRAMIPGTIGAVFLCMENDDFDEDLAQELRSQVRDEVAGAINHVVNGLNHRNLIPAVNRLVDAEVISAAVKSDMTIPVLKKISMTLQLSWSAGFGIYGVLTGIGLLSHGQDDPIGAVTVTYDQSELGPAGSVVLGASRDPIRAGSNHWDLTCTMTVHSIS
jgi:hypothetical protein